MLNFFICTYSIPVVDTVYQNLRTFINEIIMTSINHLNCLIIESRNGRAIGHCLLLRDNNDLALIDTGIGLLDTKDPEKRIGRELIDMVGFKFDESLTAIRQIEKLGYEPDQVKHCILTHLDPDHIGGLADFPNAKIHISVEELQNFKSGNPRYLPIQMAHYPDIVSYKTSNEKWFELEARKLKLNFNTDIFLIPLFGHTLRHCGVAIKQKDKWILHAGDAYYLRAETEIADHPINQLAIARADNNELRLQSLNQIRRLLKDHHDKIRIFGYHDPAELANYN